MSAFSKVGDIVDDEEERMEISKRAMAQYSKAQKAYENKVSSDEVLKLFEAAEGTMQPLLQSGLASLEAKELETVLKGRLHQAVTLAQLGEADRWPRVKALAEDVLQFDFNNAHARWLRGLALHHHFARPTEAEQECRRAVECARLQGKDAEANSWEAEVLSTFASNGPSAAAAAPAATPAPPASAAETAPETKSAMAKGFLNRGTKKPSAAARETAPGKDPAEAAKVAEVLAEAKQKEAELQSQVQQLTARLSSMESERQKEMADLTALVQEVKELPEELGPPSSASAAASIAAEKLAAGRSWAEKEQQRYVDVSTEVLTLHQMTIRESKDHEDTVEKQCTELRALSKDLSEQLKQLKSLDLRTQQATDAEPDVQRLAHHVAAFQRLPWRCKVSAVLNDAALLWLVAFMVLLGMLFALSLVVELWFSRSCRLTCLSIAERV